MSDETVPPYAAVVGTAVPPFRVAKVNGEHIRQMALILRDPNPIHFDLDAVKRAGMGSREINQGGTTMAYIVDMLAAWAGSTTYVSRIKCRFRGNVRAGDDLVAGGVVVEVRRESLVCELTCDVWVDLQDGTRVIDGTASVRLPAPEPTSP